MKVLRDNIVILRKFLRAGLWRENSPSPAEEAVASFKVRSPKSAIFGGGSLTFFGCSVTLPLAVLAHSENAHAAF